MGYSTDAVRRRLESDWVKLGRSGENLRLRDPWSVLRAVQPFGRE